MIKAIGSVFKLIFFFLNLWKEKDRVKAQKKAEIAKEIVDAFRETNNKTKASKLNAAIGSINRMR